MFESFSESARMVIFLARYEASRLRSDYIDLPHLLLGFILEDQGDSELPLRKLHGMEDLSAAIDVFPRQEGKSSFLDRDTAARLQSVCSVFGPRATPQPTHGNMPLTEGAKRALSAAFEHANGSTVTPLHLLWAVLVEDKGPIAQALLENGITREQVENEIRRRNSV